MGLLALPSVFHKMRRHVEKILTKYDPDRVVKADDHLLGWVAPLDVAYAALYLASDESRTTTGHILAVDSGLTIH